MHEFFRIQAEVFPTTALAWLSLGVVLWLNYVVRDM